MLSAGTYTCGSFHTWRDTTLSLLIHVLGEEFLEPAWCEIGFDVVNYKKLW